MSKNEMSLAIENIGGIRGRTEIKVKQPLSVIKSPNAAGKTSIIRALQLLCENDLAIEDILNEYAASGGVTLQNGERFFAQLLKTQAGVEVVSSKLIWTDEKAFNVAFCVPDAELVEILGDYEPEKLKRWFRDISDARYYESAMVVLNTLLQEKMNERERLKSTIIADTREIEKTILQAERDLANVDKELTVANNKLEELGYSELVERQRNIEDELSALNDQILAKDRERDRKRRDLNDREKYLESIEKDGENARKELRHLTDELKSKEASKAAIEMRREKIKMMLHQSPNGIIPTIDRLERDLEDYTSTLTKLEPKLPATKPCVEIIEPLIKKAKQELRSSIEERKRLDEEFDKYGATLEQIALLREKVEEIRRRIGDLNSRSRAIEREIPSIEKEIEEISSEIAKTRVNIEGKEAERAKLDKEISGLKGVSEELRNRITELREKKRDLQRVMLIKKEEQRRVLEAQTEYERVLKIVEKLQDFLSYMQKRYEYIINGARNELNKALSEAFEVMQYTNFTNLAINSEYELEITRRDGMVTKPSRLSSSEQLTIAMITMFVAKQAYAPEFPLFVIDEVMGAYDMTRFHRIVNYIKGKVPYLVITSLTPLKDKVGPEAISVDYSIS